MKGLRELAIERETVGDSNGRFILLLMALSWCIRHSETSTTYEKHVPELKSTFESLGFVDSGWNWLIQASKSNIHDFVGLVSILLGKNLIPTGNKKRIVQDSPEERIESLIKDFPIRLEDRIAASSELNLELKFTCPFCGSHDLGSLCLEPYYLYSTLYSIELEKNGFEYCNLSERDPSEFLPQGHCDGWEFDCRICSVHPELDSYLDDYGELAALARWLLDNCPQEGIITNRF